MRVPAVWHCSALMAATFLEILGPVVPVLLLPHSALWHVTPTPRGLDACRDKLMVETLWS